MSQKPLSPTDVRKQLDRISADIEKATEKGLVAAALGLKSLQSEVGNAVPPAVPLLTYIAAARSELGLGKLEAAQDSILKARFSTEPGGNRPV